MIQAEVFNTELHGSSALFFSDIQNLGVNLLGHQRKIFSAAQQLRAHLMQGQVEVWNPPTAQPVLWILCFLFYIPLLVGSAFWNVHFCRALLKPKQKSLFRAPLFILTNPTQKEWARDRISCQSLETNERRDAVQVNVRLGSWGAEELWFFGVLTRFHFIIVSFFRSSPICSPTSLTAFAAPPFSFSPSSMSTKYCKNIFVSILKEISPHKELLEDNQSLFLMFFLSCL